MKKSILSGILILVAFSFIMISCTKDEEEHFEPTITVTPSDDVIVVTPGDTVEFQVSITSTDDLISVKYTSEIGTSQQILLDSTLAAGVKSFNQNLNLIIPANLPIGTISQFSVFAATEFKSAIVDRDIEVVSIPVVTVTPDTDPIVAAAGEKVMFQFETESGNDLTGASVKLNIGGNETTVWDTTFTASVKTLSKNVEVMIPEGTAEGTMALVKFAAATEFKTTMVERNIEVAPAMDVYTGIELKAQADGPASAEANLSFYSTTTNERFNYNQANTDEASALIDLVFTHHSIYKGTETNAEMSFQSPNEQNLVTMWNDFTLIPFPYNKDNKNQTYFKLLTTVDWDNLNADGIDTTVGDIGTLTILRGLNDGDFVGFQTVEGKKGIIKITASNPEHNPYNEATITFDVKVQH